MLVFVVLFFTYFIIKLLIYFIIYLLFYFIYLSLISLDYELGLLEALFSFYYHLTFRLYVLV